MEAKSYRSWLRQLRTLTSRQRVQVKRLLEEAKPVDDACAWVNQRAQEVLACPHCLASHVQRWGKESNLQRYRCCACHKTFNALTGSPLAGLKRRDAWASYAQSMIAGASVRVAARQAGVHRTTSFRWRHRLLQLPAQERDTELHNIVEADETYFLESYKGRRNLPRPARHRGGCAAKRGLSAEQIPVLVVEDREGHHFDAVLPKVDKSTVSCLLLQVLAPESVLCTDGAGVYRATAREFALPHQSLNLSAGEHVRQRVFHIQHVNAYDSRLKSWMRRFHGVATRYLVNYLGWRRMLERFNGSLTPEILLRHAIG
jgi:transposase-like protein